MSSLACSAPSQQLSLSPTAAEAIPALDSGLKPPTVLGNGALFAFGIKGGDLNKVFAFYETEARQTLGNAAARLELALLHLLLGRKDEAYRTQAEALKLAQVFRVVGSAGKETPVRRRVLAFVAPGDFTNNSQLEFILDGSDIGLDVLYVLPGQPLPATVPDHDVAFCAVNESDENRPVLDRLAQLLPHWPRPVVNAPTRIAQLTRNGVAELLRGVPGICAPEVARVAGNDLDAIAAGSVALDTVQPGLTYPILVRPVGSHGGRNLAKIDDAAAMGAYLRVFAELPAQFYVTPFLDYRGTDGLFRKFRIAFIAGRPHLCHLALSHQWMIHYANAGMAANPGKRAEEARAMETFETEFAVRHGAALTAMAERLGLDYFLLDGGELPDGRLLVFEADIAMVIHATDSPELFPYKQPHMAKVFRAFFAMIDSAAVRPAGLPTT